MTKQIKFDGAITQDVILVLSQMARGSKEKSVKCMFGDRARIATLVGVTPQCVGYWIKQNNLGQPVHSLSSVRKIVAVLNKPLASVTITEAPNTMFERPWLRGLKRSAKTRHNMSLGQKARYARLLSAQRATETLPPTDNRWSGLSVGELVKFKNQITLELLRRYDERKQAVKNIKEIAKAIGLKVSFPI